MKNTFKSIALIGCVALSACTPQYLSWQGGRVSPGSVEGGAVKRVAGIDFWESGTPDRAYVIVGLIQDTRPSGPLFMMHRSPQLAALAREKGADAIILKSRSSELAGGFGTAALMLGGASGIASGAAIYRRSVEYLAIRYAN
jgi:hypothetical protein